MTIELFQVKLSCDNCGRCSIYELPVRNIITDYNRDDQTYSSIARPVSGKDRQLIICRHCQVPYLKVIWWEDQQVEVHENNETLEI